MSTAATVKHRRQTALANTASDVSATAWNDSLVVASAAADGALFVKDSVQPDGWGLVTAPAAYVAGDLLYASGAAALAKLADVAVGSVLVSGGVGVAPAWSASPTLTSVQLSASILFATPGTAAVGTVTTPAGAVYTRVVSTDSGQNLNLTAVGGASIIFGTNGSTWLQLNSVGTLYPIVDNSNQLGGASNRWTSLSLSTALVVGTNPATVGAVRLANGITSGLYARNAANAADVQVISLNASDQIELGNGGQTVVATGSIVTSGTLQAGASNTISWSGLTRLISSVDGKLQIYNNAVTIGVGLDVTTNGTLKVRTTAQNADANVSASLFQTMTALVALGGGAAPTLGTIGGSGPATAGQNTWLKMLDAGGVAFWVPAWK